MLAQLAVTLAVASIANAWAGTLHMLLRCRLCIVPAMTFQLTGPYKKERIKGASGCHESMLLVKLVWLTGPC